MSGWVAAILLAAGAQAAPCPHPYFPMSEGLVLTYRAGKSEVKVRLSDVEKSGPGLRAKLNLEHKGRKGQTDASCGPEGITTAMGGLEAAALRMSGMDVTIASSEGVALPPPSGLTEGAAWTNTLVMELRPPEGSKMPFGVVKSSFKKHSVVEGGERLLVAGRTWDALRIKNTVTATAGAGAERTIVSTIWMAPEVGILRIQTGDSVDFELLEVSGQKAAATGAGAPP
jgi:hypothetical protein